MADIRKAVGELRSRPLEPLTAPMRDDICLTVSGVVWIPGCGFMHAETFRDMAGEAAYQELLRRPRVVTSYDEED